MTIYKKYNSNIIKKILKYKNREFWCRGYYVDTVGKNTKKIQEYIYIYISKQLEQDKLNEQLTLNYEDPFMDRNAKQ